jgi:hypothetical protein
MKKNALLLIALLLPCVGARAAPPAPAKPVVAEVAITWQGQTASLGGPLLRFGDQDIEFDALTIGLLGYQPIPDVDVTRLTPGSVWHIASSVSGRNRDEWIGKCAAETYEADEGSVVVRYLFLNCDTLEFGQ